jgi:hypothetical protein
MRKIFLPALLFLFLLPQINSAQSKYGISIGGGYIFNSETQGTSLLQYWGHAYSANILICYNIADGTSLYLSSSYQKYYFDESSIGASAVPQVIGYRTYISAQSSYVIDISAGVKFYTVHSNAFIKPFFAAGIGALFVRQGKVDVISTMENGSSESITSYAWQNNDWSTQFNLGMGMEIKLISNFKLILEGKIVISHRLTYFPLTSSIKFDF